MYYGEVSMESLDALKMNQFRCSADNTFRTLPLSRYGLTENIKCACLQGGYEWRTPAEDVDFTGPTNCCWRFINKYIPKWHNSSDTVDINYLTQVCSGEKGPCKNGECAKNKVKCLPYCWYNRKWVIGTLSNLLFPVWLVYCVWINILKCFRIFSLIS